MSRYTIKRTPPGGHTYGIYDELLRDFCGLPRELNGPGWWLEWGTPEKAQEWLDLCVKIWAKWPDHAPGGYGPSKRARAAASRRTRNPRRS
ncbi:hypothetical protein ACWCYZ_42135 [Streptomyces virginiae]